VCEELCADVCDGWCVQVHVVASGCRCVRWCVLMCVMAGGCRFVLWMVGSGVCGGWWVLMRDGWWMQVCVMLGEAVQ
jgi:hypothetical protein